MPNLHEICSCRAASDANASIAIVNIGQTRADDFVPLKINARCGEVTVELILLVFSIVRFLNFYRMVFEIFRYCPDCLRWDASLFLVSAEDIQRTAGLKLVEIRQTAKL